MKQKDLLSQCGLKITKSRLNILDILKKATNPLTAEEIYLKCQEIEKAINLSTVYRTLETFLDKQIIIKPFIKDDTKSCFIFNHHQHKHYLICQTCHKMIEINECPFNDFEKALEKETHFTITSHQLQLFGICPNCQNKTMNS